MGEDPPRAEAQPACGVAAFWRLRTSGLLISAPIAVNAAPAAAVAAAGAGLVAALAHYGRPAGQTLVGTAVVAPRFRKLNSDIVLRAYYAAGLGKPDKADQEVRFGSQMSRDARNTGSQVLVDLPYGKGWSDVAGCAGEDRLRPGCARESGVPDPGQDQLAPPHAVRGRP